MKPSLGRAVRRHHIARLKRTRKNYWWPDRSGNTPRQLGMLTQTPAICSCDMCGSQRKYEGRTLQELREIEMMREQMEELFEGEDT